MMLETEFTYKNFFGDELTVLEEDLRWNRYRLSLKLKNGNTSNYERPLDKGNNYIQYSFQNDCEIHYVTFRIDASDNCGHGTILLDAMFKKIAKYEEKNNIKIHHVMGWLSLEDKKHGNWEKSIPFYLNFPNTLISEHPKYGLIKAELHIKEHGYTHNQIGPVVDKDVFINGNIEGDIVYYLK